MFDRISGLFQDLMSTKDVPEKEKGNKENSDGVSVRAAMEENLGNNALMLIERIKERRKILMKRMRDFELYEGRARASLNDLKKEYDILFKKPPMSQEEADNLWRVDYFYDGATPGQMKNAQLNQLDDLIKKREYDLMRIPEIVQNMKEEIGLLGSILVSPLSPKEYYPIYWRLMNLSDYTCSSTWFFIEKKESKFFKENKELLTKLKEGKFQGMIPYQPLEMENIEKLIALSEVEEGRLYPKLKTHPLLLSSTENVTGLYPDLKKIRWPDSLSLFGKKYTPQHHSSISVLAQQSRLTQ